MKKILIGLTIWLLAALLLAELFDPASPLLWVASSSVTFAIIRGVMLITLALLLFTNPPRALALRAVSMVVGMAMSVAAIVMVATYQINFLDAVIMLEVGVVCMIEALEAELYEEISIIDTLKNLTKRQLRMFAARFTTPTRSPSSRARIGSLAAK